MEDDYLESKNDALRLLDSMISGRRSPDSTLDKWISFSSHKFFSFFHEFYPPDIYPEMEDEDMEDYDGNFTLDLYDPEYIKQAWSEKDKEGLCGKNSFLIGGINDADEMIFVNFDLLKGVAILHHDEVFSSKNLDETILENMEYLNCSIENLFISLRHNKRD